MTASLVAVAVMLLAGSAAVAGYRGLVSGALTIDSGWGRRVRLLGPLTVHIAAPRQQVYDLLTQPYLGRSTRALQDKVQVLESGTDLVLAAHRTKVGKRLTAVTVETVRFTPPERIDFRLLRGPVPHVVEYFQLADEAGGTTRVQYQGELGTDGWAVGAWWGRLVARTWEGAVRGSLTAVKAEAERQTSGRNPPPVG